MTAVASSSPLLELGADYALRDGTESDWGYVIDSWRRSHYELTPHTRVAITAAIVAALRRSRLRVAHDAADAGTIVGWAAFEGDVLHYVCVRRDFRGHGIARALLDGESIARFSHWPKDLREPAAWKFSPWSLVWGDKERP